VTALNDTGVVLIGRNEGERFRRALTAALSETSRVCYVDSGSTDDSVEFARSRDVAVVELDLSTPFTAARSRNAGFARLREKWPDVEYVQFIDGDAELESGWLAKARNCLLEDDGLAAAFGQRKERFPERSAYNLICDIEWDTPVGEALACGGDSMFRVNAFETVKGFNAGLIAGEEPELCVRLRADGWRLMRMPGVMTHHDADMHTLSAWFKRMRRAGHAFAEGAAMHGKPPERHFVRPTLQALFWGIAIPGLMLLAWPLIGAWALLGFAGYAISLWRSFRHTRGTGRDTRSSAIYAASCVGGKLPQVVGVLEFAINRLRGKRTTLIEYKSA